MIEDYIRAALKRKHMAALGFKERTSERQTDDRLTEDTCPKMIE